MLKKLFPYLFLLLLAIPIVGLPLLRLNPVDINSDVFQYVSLANYYLYFDHPQIRDAFTVGPVIPILLFCLKWLALQWFSWSAQLDITLVCLVSYLSYSAIVMSLLFISRKLGIPTVIGVLLGCLFLFFLPWDSEALSPNGELVSSAFICLGLACYFGASAFTYKRLTTIALLILVAFFTKVQSLPILILCIYCFAMPAKSKGQLITLCLLIGAIIEAILFYNGSGLLYHFQGLANYTAGQSTGALTYLKQIPVRLAWIANGTVQFFPLLLWIVLTQFFLGIRNTSTPSISPNLFRFSTFWLWYGVCFVTVFLPNRFFPHYFLFFIPMVVLFSGYTARFLLTAPLKSHHTTILVICIAALTCFKTAQVLPLQKSLQETAKILYIPFALSPQADKVRMLIGTKGDNFYVHGWDYRYFAYLNKGYYGQPHLYSVQQNFQSPESYLAQLMQAPPQYILDSVEHSGFIRGANWRLTQHPVWAPMMARCYVLSFDEAGLRLYERKSPLPSDCLVH
ncbi:unannotated protein [freshwater metagenome]|uniref:Unannotated protein n=1 Tax=freshwater metagenome TaxID=449393 RepID=A0A6J6Z3A0_9ZZZZ|nr:hypothetical protein [Actinomycetota bacterium]